MFETDEDNYMYDLCMGAVKKSGCHLKDVPEKYKTYELCVTALQGFPGAIYDLPKNFDFKITDKELLYKAANMCAYETLKNKRVEKDEKMLDIILRSDSGVIKLINNPTKEMLKSAAVGRNFGYYNIPLDLRTDELYLIFLSSIEYNPPFDKNYYRSSHYDELPKIDL